MRDGDDGPGVLAEVVFEPLDALGVEVVGRLVEQQQVVAVQERLAQRDAPAFAAGEPLDRRVRRRQPHRVHRDFEVPVEVVGVGGVDLRLHLLHLVGELLEVGVGVAHRLADLFLPLQQGADVRDGLLDVLARRSCSASAAAPAARSRWWRPCPATPRP